MNNKISLFVLAAGMGSRYGGLKQMESFGPSGETIIDYSIYDATLAGFDRIIFVIRPDMEQAFKEIYISKYQNTKIKLEYVFQSLDIIPSKYTLNPQREKPWGTGHALLMAKETIKESFLVINGDDFYGRESFQISAKFLREECTPQISGITTYKLKNVLSDNGTVKRGACKVENGYLKSVEEIFELKRVGENKIDGTKPDGTKVSYVDDTSISMNMFALHPTLFSIIEEKFDTFLQNHNQDLKEEFLLPTIVNEIIHEGKAQFKVLQTNGKWFGVTYKEDADIVRTNLKELVDSGVYPDKLY